MSPRGWAHPTTGRRGHPRFRHAHGRGPGVPLHRRLFWWFGVSIALAFLSSGVVARWLGAPGHRAPYWVALVTAAGVLWMASLVLARRLVRPLRELARVARDLGDGDLSSRARVRPHDTTEMQVVARAVNDMAGRVEKQLVDQRELIAAVSHEIRSPLARVRVLSELLRDRGADRALLDGLDREVVEIDALVGDLLASSRLDFSMTSFRELDATSVAVEALERAGLPATLLVVTASNRRFDGDATLVGRALGNLLENAGRHGDGATALLVEGDGAEITFAVTDSGPGFPPELLDRAFEAFQRGQAERRGSTSLGLGLALVRRIAEAHGGTAHAENLAGGGARVALTLRRVRGGDPSPGPEARAAGSGPTAPPGGGLDGGA